MNKIAPLIGKELCEFYIVPQLLSFANDPIKSVREALANNLINMCSSLPMKVFKNKIIPIYKILAKVLIVFSQCTSFYIVLQYCAYFFKTAT